MRGEKMVKVDVISGFLGSGKTTLIKKLLSETIKDKTVLIENEFGEIGVDGSFLKDSGIEIKEINSGCICCSLVGDFEKSLGELITKYSPERIIIEPSGVGKLSDIIVAIQKAQKSLDLTINSLTTVVDGIKCKMYIKNFGEFFNNQIEAATTVIVSRADKMTSDKMETVVEEIKKINPHARIITTPISLLSAEEILKVMEGNHRDLAQELNLEFNSEEHEHHHHHDEDGECCCGHHHHDDDEEDEEHEHEHHHHHHHDEDGECCCGHHHYDDDEEEEEHEHHHHHHDEDGECCCGHHHHDDDEEEEEHEHHHHHHHHGHDADEVFTSIGIETTKVFTEEHLKEILETLSKEDNGYGTILRAKGILKGEESWLYFDLTVDEYEIRKGNPDYTGRLCVIGSNLNEDKIRELFK